MFKRVAAILSTLVFAFLILFTSILRASSVNYSFSENDNSNYLSLLKLKENPNAGNGNNSKSIEINYFFPFQGKILPDNSLWYFKALRDKIWLFLTTNSSKKAELMLLFADKRLISSKILFEKGKPRIAFSTLTKAEKYLEEASDLTAQNRKKGNDTTSFELKLTIASLKHRQIIEDLLKSAPEDIKPEVVKVMDYAKNIYNLNRDALHSRGVKPPINPFDGQ